jgi:hypothetical protein
MTLASGVASWSAKGMMERERPRRDYYDHPEGDGTRASMEVRMRSSRRGRGFVLVSVVNNPQTLQGEKLINLFDECRFRGDQIG